MELYPSPRLPKHEHSTIKLRSELLERLESARRLGYAVQRDESEPDVSAISAPLRNGDRVASFALTVALPTSRLTDAAVPTIGEAVTRYAGDVAAALGL